MIRIIFGDNGAGKSGLLAHLGNVAAFDRKRNNLMRKEIAERNFNGFNLTIPQHAVASNIDMTFSMPFCYPRKPRIINPFRLGLQLDAPKGVKCHYTLPYETILIDEAQKYFYSKGGTIEPYRTNFFEENRHNDLEIYMTTPGAMLIVKDIRRLAYCWHVLDRQVVTNRSGKVQTRWCVREIPPGDGNIETYLSKSKSEQEELYEQRIIVAPYNVFKLYDCQGCRYKYIEGHLDDDFDLEYSVETPITMADYREHEKIFNDKKQEGQAK